MKRDQIAAIAIAALPLAACGGKDTMASRSAAAYREAVAKGTPVTGGAGHGHGHGSETTTETAATGHAAHGGTAHEHADMDHAAMQHGGEDHSAHGAAMHHAQMTPAQHGAMQHGAMQHGAPGAHAQHEPMAAMPSSAPAPLTLDAPNTSAEIARTQPAATLKQDAFDAPAPTAVSEAQKAAGGGGHRGHESKE